MFKTQCQVFYDKWLQQLIPPRSIKHLRVLTIFLEYKTMNLLCLDFIVSLSVEYMLAGITLLDYANLFSPNGYKKMTK